MPQSRKDSRIRWQSALLCVCFVGMMLAFCLPGVFGSMITMAVGLGCFAVVGYCLISIAIRLAFFRCASCGIRLKSKAQQPGYSHRYFCPTCDVEWITGWRMPED
jgi:hypothetical protein